MPAYGRIENDLRLRIAQGQWGIGAMLPSRHDLAREYGVALGTMERAVAGLLADGTLRADGRRGTFVARTEASAQTDGSMEDTALSSVSPLGLRPESWQPGTVATTLGIIATFELEQPLSAKIKDFWIRPIVRSLERSFSQAGGRSRLFDRWRKDQEPISVRDAAAQLLSEGVGALAVVGIHYDPAEDLTTTLAALDRVYVPVVYISWNEIRPPLPHVFYDQFDAGYQAARHLLQSGYRRLLFLTPFSAYWIWKRLEGAREAARHLGLAPDAVRVYPTSDDLPSETLQHRELGYQAARAMFREDFMRPNGAEAAYGPWGILTPNDQTAYGVLEAARECERIAGRDFGLIGFDDDPQACFVGLTTMRPPLEELGAGAAHLLIRSLNGDKSGLQLRLRSHLVARARPMLCPDLCVSHRIGTLLFIKT